jgi:hypothetical protein
VAKTLSFFAGFTFGIFLTFQYNTGPDASAFCDLTRQYSYSKLSYMYFNNPIVIGIGNYHKNLRMQKGEIDVDENCE